MQSRKPLPSMWEQWRSEEQEFDAKTHSEKVTLNRCNHKQATFINGELRCPCGAAWGGAGIHRLAKSLANL